MKSNAFYQINILFTIICANICLSVSESKTTIITEILKWKTPIQIPLVKNGD